MRPCSTRISILPSVPSSHPPVVHSCADTTKKYEASYKKNPDKGGACPPPGGPYCENPGGSVKDPLISRPGPFESQTGVKLVEAKKPEPKKEEKKEEKEEPKA